MTEPREVTTNNLVERSGTDALGKLRKSEVTAERHAAALLERCQQGKALNAVCGEPIIYGGPLRSRFRR